VAAPSVTPDDLASLQHALSNVQELMSAKVKTLTPTSTVEEAVAIFTAGQFRHLPVTHDGRLVGIVSDRDVLRAIASDAEASSASVAQIMTADPAVVSPGSSLGDALREILRHRINCLPVVDGDGQLKGILTTTDLLRALYAVQYWLENRIAAGTDLPPA